MSGTQELSMSHYLDTLERFGLFARSQLLEEGYAPGIVWRMAERAARHGYTKYDVSPDRAWLTGEGRAFRDSIRQVRSSGLSADEARWVPPDSGGAA